MPTFAAPAVPKIAGTRKMWGSARLPKGHEQLVRSRGWEIVGTYSERVSAGAKKRPEYERLLKDAHRGQFDTIVVWSLDRLGRSMLGNIAVILELEHKGIQVVSVREGWLDTDSGHVRNLLLGVLSWVAEQERLRLGERVRAGIARARREGVHLGRPRADIDLAEALQLKSEGASLRTMASTIGCSTSALQRLLALSQNPLESDPTKHGEIDDNEPRIELFRNP
jgi:DNA invertase Pin-like site-specific DNA recombinase